MRILMVKNVSQMWWLCVLQQRAINWFVLLSLEAVVESRPSNVQLLSGLKSDAKKNNFKACLGEKKKSWLCAVVQANCGPSLSQWLLFCYSHLFPLTFYVAPAFNPFAACVSQHGTSFRDLPLRNRVTDWYLSGLCWWALRASSALRWVSSTSCLSVSPKKHMQTH